MCRYRHSDDFSLRFFSTPSDHSEVKMLEWKMFRTGFPADQKFLFEEISASRKTERKKVIFFLARRMVNVTATLFRLPYDHIGNNSNINYRN